MNPDSPQNPQEKLEASLTSLLLGELPHDEAAALHQQLAQDPELSKLYERLKETISVVRETMHSPADSTSEVAAPLKLSEDRREKLLVHFKTVAPTEFAEPKKKWRPSPAQVAIAASVLAIFGVTSLFVTQRSEQGNVATQTDSLYEIAAAQNGHSSVKGDKKYAEPPREADVTFSFIPAPMTGPESKPVAPAIVLPSTDGQLVPSQTSQHPAPITQLASGVESKKGNPGSEGKGFSLLGPAAEPASDLFNDDVGARQPGQVAANKSSGITASGGTSPMAADQVSDPRSLGFLEKSNQTPDQNANRFIGRYAYQAVRSNYNYDLDAFGKLAETQKRPELDSKNSMLADAGRRTASSEAELLRDTPAAGFAFGSESETAATATKDRSLSDLAKTTPSKPWSISAGDGASVQNFGLITTNAFAANGTSAGGQWYYDEVDHFAQMPKPRAFASSATPPLSTATAKRELLQGDRTEPAIRQEKEKSSELLAYQDAQASLDALKRFKQITDMKIAGEKIDVTLPKTTMVDIIDKAIPATQKSSSLWERIRGDSSRDYRSSTRIKVERDQSDIVGFAEHGAGSAYDPYFIQTEFELIQSKPILEKVIKDQKLREAWSNQNGGNPLSTDEAIVELRKHLELRAVNNTGLVEIKVSSEDPQQAANIANALADAYNKHRKQQRDDLSLGGIRALEEQDSELSRKIQAQQEKVDKMRAQLTLSDSKIAGPQQASDVASPKPAAPPLIPQPEVQTADNGFSTFSLNVSDVSFKLAGASLEKGQMPDPGTVRSEEFINAFDYRDPEPAAGVPVAFAWERAQYPFAQNRDLLRLSLKTAALGRQPGKPLNLVLLLDNSGSMERADRVRIVHEALRVLAGQLQPQDKLSIVVFARTARLWVDGAAGDQAGKVVEQITSLTPEGGTNLEEAMNLAYQTALRHYLANGVNRVVLLTDGAANLGEVEPDSLKAKVETYRKQGVALDCFGIGWEGFNDDLLEALSRNGDGRYGFINSPEEATTEFASQLAGALHVAASDVKVQIEFNPKRATAWRQIGYAKHQLTKEQFRDNTVDAAEIGAAESGNALYTVQVNPAGEGPIATVRARFKVPGTSDYREHEWTVPYSGNAVALDQATPAMRLAATASAFSEWLAASPYAGEVSPDALLRHLTGIPEQYGADARPKKLEWMIRQAKSLSGK